MLDALEIREGTMLAGRYRVIERLGTGGMSTVYLAEDCVLGRRVAVKRMRTDSRSRADTERFRREARLGASLSHPGVVTVFDTVAAEDGVLIVMEYVEGETLADEIDRGPIAPKRTLAILEDVAAALDHAHSHGVIHRDVKPGNVLLARDGGVKLADLGIATAVESTRITSVNDIVGTLVYIAPERLEASRPGGPESDVYSLAVLTWEMLSGEELNRGSTPAEVLHRVTTGAPPDLREAWPDAPESVVRTLQDAMDPDPQARPRSAGEFVERLWEALEAPILAKPLEATEPPTPPTAIAAEPPPGPTVSRRGPRVAAVAGLVLAAIAVLAIVLVADGGDESDSGGGTPLVEEERGGGEGRSREPARAQAPAPAPEEVAPAETPTETTEAPAAPGEDPAALNDQGFALIQEGRYEEAIPILQRAVDSYPEGSTDLTYAYALFNLGNALRLAGRPEEAIPILEQRLEIPNQTETVQRELELARREAGGGELE